MTRQVWINGDIGDPKMCDLYDEATGKHIPDVREMSVAVHAGSTTGATLYFHGGTAETVDIVPRPKHKHAGKKVLMWTLKHERDPSVHADVLSSVIQERVILDNGRVSDVQQTHEAQRFVDDLTLKQHLDPKDLLRWEAEEACQASVKQLYKDMVAAMLPSGGVVGSAQNSAPAGGTVHIAPGPPPLTQADVGRAVIVDEPACYVKPQRGTLVSIHDAGAGLMAKVNLDCGTSNTPVQWYGAIKYVEFAAQKFTQSDYGKAVIVDDGMMSPIHGTLVNVDRDEVTVKEHSVAQFPGRWRGNVRYVQFDTGQPTTSACTECYGTGYHNGIGGPCSKGCAAP